MVLKLAVRPACAITIEASEAAAEPTWSSRAHTRELSICRDVIFPGLALVKALIWKLLGISIGSITKQAKSDIRIKE